MSLIDQQIFLNAPCNFNDPYDFAPNFRLSRPSKEEAARCIEVLQKNNPNDNTIPDLQLEADDEYEKFCDEIVHNIAILLKLYIKRSSEDVGVSCFAESKDIMLMWSHYANHHKGFCLEYDTKEEPFCNVCPVDYVIDFPEIKSHFLFEDDDLKTYIRLLTTKFRDWSYEREWRIIGPSAGSKLKYSSQALKAIYFGTKTDPQDMETIRNIVRSYNENVQLYKGKMNETRFQIDFEKIE